MIPSGEIRVNTASRQREYNQDMDEQREPMPPTDNSDPESRNRWPVVRGASTLIFVIACVASLPLMALGYLHFTDPWQGLLAAACGTMLFAFLIRDASRWLSRRRDR